MWSASMSPMTSHSTESRSRQASTPPSSPPAASPAAVETKAHQPSGAGEQARGASGDDDEDADEEMSTKARALTNLLKTSSVCLQRFVHQLERTDGRAPILGFCSDHGRQDERAAATTARASSARRRQEARRGGEGGCPEVGTKKVDPDKRRDRRRVWRAERKCRPLPEQEAPDEGPAEKGCSKEREQYRALPQERRDRASG